jgi:hypothetical protein
VTGEFAEGLKKMLAGPRKEREHSTSPPQQKKQPRVDDRMALELPAATPQPIAQNTVQTYAAIVAVTADQGIVQPAMQPDALAVVPSTWEERASAVPDSDLRAQVLAAALAFAQDCTQQIHVLQQQKAEAEWMVQQLQADLPSHAEHMPPMPPPMQPTSTQPPDQTPPQQQQQPPKQPSPKQPSKQPPKQPPKQPTRQLQYAKVVAQTCSAMTTAAVQAILPALTQTQPQWQQQTSMRKQNQQQNQQQNQRQNQRQQRAAIGVDRLAHRCHFTVSGPSLDTSGTATQVVQRVISQVEGGDGVVVVDAARVGPAASPRFHFKIATVEQAEILIRGRGKALAGSGIVLSEVLSAAEAERHKQLYPDFLRLQEAGHKVQFRRARLFVDGQLWSTTGGGAAA